MGCIDGSSQRRLRIMVQVGVWDTIGLDWIELDWALWYSVSSVESDNSNEKCNSHDSVPLCTCQVLNKRKSRCVLGDSIQAHAIPTSKTTILGTRLFSRAPSDG